MNKEKMNKSIDNILLSIESNKQTIDEMISAAKENNTLISSEMQKYAAARSRLDQAQISAYADYARAYSNVKQLYGLSAEIHGLNGISNIHNTELAYSMLDEVHTKQLTLMEQICSLLEKAKLAVSLLIE